jgi:hypothetical protein
MEIRKAKIPKEYQIKLKDATPNGYPQKYFGLIIAGSSRSGKTTCICHLLDQIAPAYKTVLVFTPSVEDPIWTSLQKHENIFFADIVSNHILNTVFQRQKKLHSQNKENSLLIVIDDYGILARITGQDVTKAKPDHENFSSGIKQSLDILYSRARHFSTSIMTSFHDALQPSPLQRVNATHWIIYRLNERQYEKIAPELKCQLSDKEFLEKAHEFTKDPFNFLFVDLKALHKEDVFKHGKPSEF